ncbi:MAG: helix-turn-helix domain-containing protein [Micromonosporaceae bacterium]|nr:helix-turn-helix domain-containing protein [Micromonosporaceae bacterium]
MPRRAVVDPRFAAELRRLRQERNLSLRDLAGRAYVAKSTISELENGSKSPTLATTRALDKALSAGDVLVGMVSETSRPATPEPADDDGDEEQALELARRVAATDVGAETLTQIEAGIDDLATAYPKTSPGELLRRVRRHIGYVTQLFEARKTLDEHRRLVVAAGWLSLLAATLHIDLHQRPSAAARLRVARQMGQHAQHREVQAWCVETAAWDALTEGDHRQALRLSRAAQEVAPSGSSAFIQATAQEGRACARLNDRAGTYNALDRMHRLVSPLPRPERPEHHYQYDPAKADAYTATTLSWVGDTAAIDYARQVITRLESADDGPARPRRAASARLDLALALLAAGEPEEAEAVTLYAIGSGLLVPSNYWRVQEVISTMTKRGIPGVTEVRDAYRALLADG